MTQFIEFQIDGKVHLVNVDNIAMVKQIDINTLEFSLLTKDENNVQIKNGKGYDHNFVLNINKSAGLNTAAITTGDKTGIVMEVLTEEPGVQFYGGNFMQSK